MSQIRSGIWGRKAAKAASMLWLSVPSATDLNWTLASKCWHACSVPNPLGATGKQGYPAPVLQGPRVTCISRQSLLMVAGQESSHLFLGHWDWGWDGGGSGTLQGSGRGPYLDRTTKMNAGVPELSPRQPSISCLSKQVWEEPWPGSRRLI